MALPRGGVDEEHRIPSLEGAVAAGAGTICCGKRPDSTVGESECRPTNAIWSGSSFAVCWLVDDSGPIPSPKRHSVRASGLPEGRNNGPAGDWLRFRSNGDDVAQTGIGATGIRPLPPHGRSIGASGTSAALASHRGWSRGELGRGVRRLPLAGGLAWRTCLAGARCRLSASQGNPHGAAGGTVVEKLLRYDRRSACFQQSYAGATAYCGNDEGRRADYRRDVWGRRDQSGRGARGLPEAN